MAAIREKRSLPGWVSKLGVATAALVLIVLFGVRGFPYDALAERITEELAQRGLRVQIAKLGPAIGPTGPALEATGVRATLSNGQTLQFDRMLTRPAWSTAWFSLAPAIYLELDGPLGAVEGVLEWSAAPDWDARVTGLDLARVPFGATLSGADVTGRMDVTLDLRLTEQGIEGPVVFEARDGTLKLPDSPIALPYDRLSGSLSFGGEVLLEVASLELTGPLASASGKGTIGRAASFDDAELQMDLSLNVKPAFAGVIRAAGLLPDPNGTTKLHLWGTVSNPKIR